MNSNYMDFDYDDDWELTFHDSTGRIKRFVGVEIEVSHFDPAKETDLYNVIKKWGGVIKGDGSIRGENEFEINTAPAKGRKFVTQIKEICKVLKEGKAKANKSCGLHVHVDARDFEEKDKLKAVLLWSKIEGQMLEKVPAYRRNNSYAVPWETTAQDLNRLKFDNGKYSFRRVVGRYFNYDRYHTMNFGAFNSHKTLENRMHQGTVNAKKIIEWARLNSQILDFVKKARVKDLKDVDSISLESITEAA